VHRSVAERTTGATQVSRFTRRAAAAWLGRRSDALSAGLARGPRGAYDLSVPISDRDLERFARPPEPLPATVSPRLTLAEEVALLTLGASRMRARDAVRVAGAAHRGTPQDHAAAMHALERRGMVRRASPLRSRVATPQAKVAPRQSRVMAIIRHPAAPAGADAELLALLAAAQVLELPRAPDRMRARQQIRAIGTHEEVPPAVKLLAEERKVDTMAELADALVPAARDLGDASFDPGQTPGIGAGGF
jgi:hypothetical protein